MTRQARERPRLWNRTHRTVCTIDGIEDQHGPRGDFELGCHVARRQRVIARDHHNLSKDCSDECPGCSADEEHAARKWAGTEPPTTQATREAGKWQRQRQRQATPGQPADLVRRVDEFADGAGRFRLHRALQHQEARERQAALGVLASQLSRLHQRRNQDRVSVLSRYEQCTTTAARLRFGARPPTADGSPSPERARLEHEDTKSLRRLPESLRNTREASEASGQHTHLGETSTGGARGSRQAAVPQQTTTV